MKFVKSILYFIAVLALAMFLVTLGSVNGQQVHVNFLISQDDFSLPSLLVSAFFAGFLIAACTFGLGYLVVKLRLRRLQKRFSAVSATATQPESPTVAKD